MKRLQLLPGLFMVLLSLNLVTVVSGYAKAIGPDRPVCAFAGEEALLPCHLPPSLSAEDINVAWTKGRLNTMVYLYHNGTEHKERHDRKYQGRTGLITKDIARGSVALRIHNIRRSDEGTYTCSFYSDAVEASVGMVLRVADKLNLPEIDPVMSEQLNSPFSDQEISKAIDSMQGEKSACDLKRELDILTTDTDILQKEVDQLTTERDALNREKYAIPRKIDDPNEGRGCLKYENELKVKEEELRWVRSFADDVTLDADTANPFLRLSEDRRNVTCSNKAQKLPDTPERYDTRRCVLGHQRISSGRHYWEVEVWGVSLWYLGVCDESVSRKGEFKESQEGGYWVVSNYFDSYRAHTSPSLTLLAPIEHPRTVGIFLDYEAGRVSFYDVEEQALLFTFPDYPFSNRTLRPYFCSGVIVNPLRLLPVKVIGDKVLPTHQYN